MARRFSQWSLVVATVMVAARLDAQSHWAPRLQLDNDVYNFWVRHTHRPDEEYTNGVRASIETQRAVGWGAWARHLPDCAVRQSKGASCRSTGVTLGQELYTPRLDRAPGLVTHWEDERPFFAWLYLEGSARAASERTFRSVNVSLGVTGPPAGGKLAQSLAHTIGFNRPATGWETQIGFEPGVVVEYQHSMLAVKIGTSRGLSFDLTPNVGVSLGNVRTRAELGGVARLGWNLSHVWYTPAWAGRRLVEGWVLAGGRVEGAARDMSLDGTLAHPTRHVERRPGVSQYEFGGGVRVHSLSLSWRAITRSREYRTGPAHHTYSIMTAGLDLLP